MDVAKHNFNFCLEVRIEDGKDTILPIDASEPWQDKFVTRDEAELQALTLSRLPKLKVRGWQNSVSPVDMAQASVCVIQMRGWFVSEEFKNGESGYYGSDARGRKKTAKEIVTERQAAEQAARPLPSFIPPGRTRENWLDSDEQMAGGA